MLALNDASAFGQRVVDQYIAQGWGSLSKRDLELLLFILLENDGALARGASNYDVARALRVTESKAAALRKDSYAKWRSLTSEEPAAVLKRVFHVALTEQQLNRLKYATARSVSEGFVPLLVEHPDDRAEVEHAIKAAGAIPVFERNREVVLIHYETLLEIAQGLALLETDPLMIHKELKKLFDRYDAANRTKGALRSLLTAPVGQLTPAEARAALNDAGAIVIEGAFRKLLPALLKIAIPTIP